MLKKLMIVIIAGVVFWGIFASNIVAKTIEKPTPTKIPLDQIVPSSPTPLTGDKGFCLIQSDSLTGLVFYITWFDTGDGFVLYMDPAKCGLPDPYPFKVTDVHFYLYDFTNAVWPVEIQVNIWNLSGGVKCNGPGNLLGSQTFTIPIDSSLDSLGRPMNLKIDSLCCAHNPFFLEIKYTGGTGPPYPSLFMTDTTDAPDTCDAWVWYFYQTQHWYFEWSNFWASPLPGYPIMRITGYTQQCHPESCWYWKPDRPEQRHSAPSGMPDFDQNQDAWQSYCGPTAVANCLWWFNAVPEGWTPPQLIDTLATRMHCRPEWGTYVDTMQMALDQYFKDYGFALQESTFQMPDFHEMEDSLKRSQDIILLLGFWWYDGEFWHREGGHFVTMAGVCSESLKIAISDPDNDGAVGGAPGRVRPPTHPPAGTYPPALHNDPTYVSHDMYNSNLNPQPPSPGNPFWEINYGWGPVKYSGINVPKEFIAVTKPAPKDDVAVVYATEVEYAIMICPKPTAVEEEEEESGITPKDFELYQSYPNPFNNQTIIKYDLLKPCQVSLTIYNILGQKVKTLVNERQEAGSKTVSWDGKDEKGKDMSSGIYFYQLSTVSMGKVGEITQTNRMILLK
jgi:hypothetical protein